MFGSKNIVGLSLALSFVLLSCIANTTSSHAKILSCERYSKSGDNEFVAGAFDSWYPKTLQIPTQEFKSIPGRTVLVFERSMNEDKSGHESKMVYTLLSSKKLMVGSPSIPGSARYKCDMKPEEVLAAQTSPSKPSTAGEELSKAKKMFDGHSENALCHTATWVDGNRLNFWESTDFSGSYPKGNYASLLAQHLGYNCNVGKYDKKIVVCHQAISASSSASTLEWAETNPKYYTDKNLAKDIENQVTKAKQMGLDCLKKDIKGGVSDTTSSSKIDKAKSTCKDIGFTAGTERFGECVLKMMDK